MDFIKRQLGLDKSGYTQLKNESPGAGQDEIKQVNSSRGRKITRVKSSQKYSLKKVKDDTSVKQAVHNQSKGRISLKKIRVFHKQKEQGSASVREKNQSHLKNWLSLDKPSSPLSRALRKTCPATSLKSMSQVEKARVRDAMMEKIMTSEKKLGKSDVEAACQEHLADYQSTFSQAAPEVSGLVRSYMPQQPVFAENIQVLAENVISSRSGTVSRHLSRFADLTEKNNLLVRSSPYELRSSHSFSRQIATTRGALQRLDTFERRLSVNDRRIPETLNSAILSDIKTQKAQLKNHMAYLMELKKQDFSSTKNAVIIGKMQIDTAKNILTGLIEKAESTSGGTSKSSALDPKVNAWKKMRSQLEKRKTKLTPDRLRSFSDIREFTKHHQKIMQTCLRDSGVSSSGIKKHWPASWVKATNETKWPPIDKKINIRCGESLKQYQSTITPAATLVFDSGEDYEPIDQRSIFEHDYQGGACASPTKDRTDHALNLHQTKLVVNDESGKAKKELFAGIRTGTVAAQKINDPKKRKEAGLNWAREIATAALHQKISSDTSMMDKVRQGEKIPLRLTSTSLLTPDWLRHITHINDDELSLQREQYEALHTLASSKEPLIIYDTSGKRHEVNLDLEVATLNVGVNAIAFNKILSGVGHPWQQSDRYTREGLVTLLGHTESGKEPGGWTGEWLEQNPDHPSREIVLQLSQQITQIFNTQTHHKQGTDAYKLMTRLQMLSCLIGAVPHFNCKSGKDRTGEADASIKTLASEIEQKGYVPEPEDHWSMERKELQQAMMYGAGEEEVLIYNTGDPRFKTSTGKELQGDLYKYLHF